MTARSRSGVDCAAACPVRPERGLSMSCPRLHGGLWATPTAAATAGLPPRRNARHGAAFERACRRGFKDLALVQAAAAHSGISLHWTGSRSQADSLEYMSLACRCLPDTTVQAAAACCCRLFGSLSLSLFCRLPEACSLEPAAAATHKTRV
jgi:hypothetical protein